MMDALRHHMQHVRSRRGRDQENRRDVEPPDMQRHGFSPLQASAQPSVRVERGRDTDAPASRLRSKRTDEGRLAPIPGKNKRAPKIGRAHVLTPVTNAHLVCRLLLEKKKNTNTKHKQE